MKLISNDDHIISQIIAVFVNMMSQTEVGIYKRKQKSKKTRKQELDQESDQENKKTFFFS